MTALSSSVVFIVFNFLFWTFTRGDVTDVSCHFNERCILPCKYNSGDEPVIHWLQGKEETKVHTYYHQQDQLLHQAPSFKGRTSLFKDQISRGNASLMLTGLRPQDEGRFKCYTSTIKGHQESFVDLKVEAPVSKVDINRKGDTIICTSENIYPKPELVWSTLPASNNLKEPTTKDLQTEQQLYSINSSLVVPESDDSMSFICTVSSRAGRKTATLFKSSSITWSGSETEIPCTDSGISYTFLIWKFNNTIILEQSGTDKYKLSPDWVKYVKDLSETGTLTLKDLAPEHGGMFTCELRNSGDQYVKTTLVDIPEGKPEETHGSARAIAIGVPCLLLVLLALIGGIYCCRRRVKKQKPASAKYTKSRNYIEEDGKRVLKTTESQTS